MSATPTANCRTMRVVQARAAEPQATTRQLDKPTVQRQRGGRRWPAGEPAAAPSEELLDIPAFLRRQAD